LYELVHRACFKTNSGQLRVIDSPTQPRATGPQGLPGMSGYEIVPGPGVNIDSDLFGGSGTDTAICSAGKKVVGGGYTTNPPKGSVIVSAPVSNTGWTVTLFVSAAAGPTRMTAFAICVFAS
jgi:hypothetical protein